MWRGSDFDWEDPGLCSIKSAGTHSNLAIKMYHKTHPEGSQSHSQFIPLKKNILKITNLKNHIDKNTHEEI